MDPDANIEEQLRLATRMAEGPISEHEGRRLAELVLALDEWLVRKGFKPRRWS